MTRIEALVVGLGVHGSAIAGVLSRRGLRVAGLDAAPEGAVWGASAGPWRMLRERDPERPHLDVLARRARRGWEALERRQRVTLIIPSTALAMPPGGPGLPVPAGDVRLRGLAPRLRAGGAAADPDSALLDATAAVRALRADAVAAGARLYPSQPVQPRLGTNGQLRVDLAGEPVRAGITVLALGRRVVDLPADLRPVGVSTEPAFMQVAHGEPVGLDPAFFYLLPSGTDRFCVIPRPGLVQFGHLTAGAGGKAAARHRDQEALRRLVPGAAGLGEPTTYSAAYTHTASGGFELHRVSSGVAILVACSAVGFKFAPALAEEVVDRLLDPTEPEPAGLPPALRVVILGRETP